MQGSVLVVSHGARPAFRTGERRSALVPCNDTVVWRTSCPTTYGRAMTNNERPANRISATSRQTRPAGSHEPRTAGADALALYLHEIARYRLLTRAEEVQLAK